jgi:hypothetical protein
MTSRGAAARCDLESTWSLESGCCRHASRFTHVMSSSVNQSRIRGTSHVLTCDQPLDSEPTEFGSEFTLTDTVADS